MRRRLLVWAGYAALALALGYAITSIARLTPLYDQPMLPKENHRTLGQIFDDIGPSLRSNGPLQWKALVGYLTIPGVVLAVIGAISAWRRHRAATAILLRLGAERHRLGAAARPVAVSALLRGRDRAALGVRRARRRGGLERASPAARGTIAAARIAVAACCSLVAARRPRCATRRRCSPTPCTRPIRAPIEAYVAATERADLGRPRRAGDRAARRPLSRADRRRPAARTPVGPRPPPQRLRRWARRAATTSFVTSGTPAQRASARYLVSDGAHSDAPPRPGYRLIKRRARC